MSAFPVVVCDIDHAEERNQSHGEDSLSTSSILDTPTSTPNLKKPGQGTHCQQGAAQGGTNGGTSLGCGGSPRSSQARSMVTAQQPRVALWTWMLCDC